MHFSDFLKQSDFFQSVHDFLQGMVETFGTGLNSLDEIPDIFVNVWHWFSLTFDFLPEFFVTIFAWFAIACIVIRFLRW